jgi:hypothetical protein
LARSPKLSLDIHQALLPAPSLGRRKFQGIRPLGQIVGSKSTRPECPDHPASQRRVVLDERYPDVSLLIYSSLLDRTMHRAADRTQYTAALIDLRATPMG